MQRRPRYSSLNALYRNSLRSTALRTLDTFTVIEARQRGPDGIREMNRFENLVAPDASLYYFMADRPGPKLHYQAIEEIPVRIPL